MSGTTLKTLYDFGAKGDGTTDDTAAVQSAFNATTVQGLLLLGTPGLFRITAPVVINSNTSYHGLGAWFLKDYQDSGYQFCFENEALNSTTALDTNILLRDLWIKSGPNDKGGQMLGLVNVQGVLVAGFKSVKAPTSPSWTMCLAGVDIMIRDPEINSASSPIYGDGIHVTAAKDLTISGARIYAEDDAIALHKQNSGYNIDGNSQIPAVHDNILIEGCILSSTAANALRCGLAAQPGDPAHQFGTVQVANSILLGPITLGDDRTTVNAGVTGGTVDIINSRFANGGMLVQASTVTPWTIGLRGIRGLFNPDIQSGAAQKVTMSDLDVFGSPTIYALGSIEGANIRLATSTTGNGAQLGAPVVDLDHMHLTGSGQEFRGVLIDQTNAAGNRVRFRNGTIEQVQRGLSSTNGFVLLDAEGTDFYACQYTTIDGNVTTGRFRTTASGHYGGGASIAAGASSTVLGSSNVPYASPGDIVEIGTTADLLGLVLTGVCTTAGSISLRLTNPTSAAIMVPAFTYKVSNAKIGI